MSTIDRYTLRDLGVGATIPVQDASEDAARQRLSVFVSGLIYDYETGRESAGGQNRTI